MMDNVISTIEAAIWSFWGLLVYGALIFIGSAVSVWQEQRRLDRVEATPISSSSREQWLAEFAQWNAVDPSAPEDERERLLQQHAVVVSYQTLGEGLSGLLSGSMLMGFAFAIRGVVAAPSSAIFLLYFSALQTVLATMHESGRFLGYRAGALRISRGRALPPTGEVRALGDYVAPWVWLVPIAAPTSILLMFTYIVVATRVCLTNPAMFCQ